MGLKTRVPNLVSITSFKTVLYFDRGILKDMVFQTRKIQSETLSEYLYAVRIQLGLNIAEVSERTGIQKKFIEILESGNVSLLPAEVYVCGFLKKLSKLYRVDEAVLIRQYKKERGIVDNISEKKSFFSIPLKNLFSITPKTVGVAVAMLFLVGTVGYVALQLRGMSQNPTITVISPSGGSLLTDSFVKVVGKTEPGNTLEINSESVFVSQQGDFSATVSVAPGQIELIFIATNKFNKTTTKTLALIRDPEVQATRGEGNVVMSLGLERP